MVKRGVVILTTANGDFTNETIADVVEKTSGGYTEYLVRKTSSITREYANGTLIGTYDEGGEETPTLYNHLTLAEIFVKLSGNGYTAAWNVELTEV